MRAPCDGEPNAALLRRRARRRPSKMATKWQRNVAAAVRALATTWLLTSAITISRASPVAQQPSDSDGDAGRVSVRPSAAASTTASTGIQQTAEYQTTAAIVELFSELLSPSSGMPFDDNATMPPRNHSSGSTPAKTSRQRQESDDVNQWLNRTSSVAPGFYVLVVFLVVGPLGICCGVGWYHCSDVCLYFLCPGKLLASAASAASATAGASTSGTQSGDRNPVLALRRAIHRRRAAAGGVRRVARASDAASSSAMGDMSPYEVIRYIALSMHNSGGQQQEQPQQQQEQEQEQEQQHQQQQWLQVPTAVVHVETNRARVPADATTATTADDETAEMATTVEWHAGAAAAAEAAATTLQDQPLATAATTMYDETAFAGPAAHRTIASGDESPQTQNAAEREGDDR